MRFIVLHTKKTHHFTSNTHNTQHIQHSTQPNSHNYNNNNNMAWQQYCVSAWPGLARPGPCLCTH
jgi:hypothetical protein